MRAQSCSAVASAAALGAPSRSDAKPAESRQVPRDEYIIAHGVHGPLP
jgi:hypothetical protein